MKLRWCSWTGQGLNLHLRMEREGKFSSAVFPYTTGPNTVNP
jgi:hypothetical protein